MNILLVSQYFYPEKFPHQRCGGSSGKGRASGPGADWAARLHRRPGAPRLPLFSASGGRAGTAWKSSGCPPVPAAWRRFPGVELRLFCTSGIIYARLCRFRADLVLSYQTSPMLQALPALSHKKRTGAPLLLYCCDLWPESLKAWNVGRGPSAFFRLMKRWSRRIYQGRTGWR